MQSSNTKPKEERRQYPREPVRHPATLESPEFGQCEVLVQNYCPGGLYITAITGGPLADDAVASKLQVDAEVFVRVLIREQSKMVAARIARVGELGLGVAFYRPHHGIAQQLAEIAAEQGFGSTDQASLADSDRGQVLTAFRKQINTELERNIVEFLSTSQDELMDASSKATSDVGQSPFFEAMSILRRQGDAIKRDFLSAVETHLKAFEQIDLFPEFQARSDEGELSLVDESEFDTWLTLSDIIHSVEVRNLQALHALEARLNVLIEKHVDTRSNPVSPAAVCHHFYETLRNYPIDQLAGKTVWKCFGQIVTQRLDALYKRLNEQLKEAGVLPKLTFRYASPSRPAQPPQAQPQGASEGQTQDVGPPAEAPAPGVPLSELGSRTGAMAPALGSALGSGMRAAPAALQSGSKIIDLRDIIQQRQMAADQAAAGGTVKSHTGRGMATPFGMDELNEALAQLQQAGGDHDGPLGERVQGALKARFGGKAKRSVAEEHANAIYLAQQLLDAIRSDDVVEPHAKTWIQQLEIPVLRMLLEDDELLRNQEHPARKVINHLGRSHVESGPQTGDRERELIEGIQKIVDELSRMDKPDRAAFQDAADQLDRLLKRQQRLRATQMRRVLEACEGQQRLENARQLVQQELDQRFSGSDVPKVLLQILDLGLRSLLDLAAVRGGVESEEWQKVIRLVDDLRHRLEPQYEGGDSAAEDSQKLLSEVSERLVQAGVPGTQLDDVREELEHLLPGVRPDDAAPKLETVTYEAQEPEEPEAEDEDEDEDIDPETALWHGRAKMLEVGSWLVLPGGDGGAQAHKLAWVNEKRDRFVFVDRQGRKALEVTLEELANKLRSEDTDVVDQTDQPLMDRSWQGMIERMHEQIAHQATHDQLTGALNRKEFERQLRLKLGESKLMHSQHVVLQLDIDQFKVINSTAGHDAGDQLLRDLSHELRTNTPEDAEIARVGGDEFAVLLPRHEPGPGHEVAEVLRKKISSHRTKWKRRKLKSTSSIGLTSMDSNSRSVSEILNQLESACAAAKEAGRDRVKSYQLDDEELNRRDEAMHWVNELERALDTDRIVLYGQRILPLGGENPREHYEVLARMIDEEGKVVSPEMFVPAAEAYGRIHYLDEWVFRRAFELLAKAPRKDSIERLSLNVSGKTFSRPRFVDEVKRLLNETGVSPSKICFEITETAAISNLSRCTDFLRELRYLGCRFSLDDFGTGMSSFSYLKHLPVDYLKIDGSFVKEIVESSADLGLVKTINEIGHFLGKQTVAEYCENEEILNVLKDIGLDFAQGYGIARPSPLTDLLGIED